MQTQTILGAWREFAKINAETVARLAGVPVDTYTALEAGALVPDANLASALELLFHAKFPAAYLLFPFVPMPNSTGLLKKLSSCFRDFAKGKVAGQQRRVA